MKQSKPRISCVPFRCVCKGEPSQQIFVLWFEDTLDLMVWHKFDFCYLLILFLSSVPFGLPFCPGLCRQSFGKSISATANVHTSMTSTTNFRFLCSTFVFVSFLSIKLRGLYAGEFFFIYYLLTLRFQMENFCIKYCSEEQRKKKFHTFLVILQSTFTSFSVVFLLAVSLSWAIRNDAYPSA